MLVNVSPGLCAPQRRDRDRAEPRRASAATLAPTATTGQATQINLRLGGRRRQLQPEGLSTEVVLRVRAVQVLRSDLRPIPLTGNTTQAVSAPLKGLVRLHNLRFPGRRGERKRHNLRGAGAFHDKENPASLQIAATPNPIPMAGC